MSNPLRMNKPDGHGNQGYIALISAIIISVLLLIITFAVNFSSFFARFNILDSEFKKVSAGLAEACVDTAILEIAKDNIPSNDTCINVGDACASPIPPDAKVCKICEVTEPNPDKFVIRARAAYQNAYTNLLVDVTKSPTDVTVDSWEEETNYSEPPPCDFP